MEIVMIMLSAILTNNVVLNQSYGLCPYIGVSKKVSTSFKLSLAVLFVLTCSTILNYIIYNFILIPLNLTYLNTIAFILIIATFVQCVDLFIKRFAPKLYQVLGIYLPLITTNCIILGVVELVVPEVNFGIALLKAICFGVGFMLAICLLASIRESINKKDVPKISNELPIVLVLAGLIAMAFSSFSGMVSNPATDKVVATEGAVTPLTILWATLILLAIMVISATLIYLSTKILIKKGNKDVSDKEIDEILKHLPGANCGACGNPSCREFAKKLIKGEKTTSGCKVLKQNAKTALEEYLKGKNENASGN